MRAIKDILHEKRKKTEEHIEQFRQAGELTVRYTAMMPDIPFLLLGLCSDIGWIIHLIAGIVYFCRNGFCHVADGFAIAALAAVMFGVGYLVYLNRIHEKEIAAKWQKGLSFGMTAFAGLAGAIVVIVQIAEGGDHLPLVWIVIGGALNFVSCLPIYLSFKKGIVFGVK